MARLRFYHLMPFFVFIIFSLKHNFLERCFERTKGLSTVYSLWGFERIGLLVLILITVCFNFRRTLGNSLYCLPHRTGKFTSDVVRVCVFNKPVTTAMYCPLLYGCVSQELGSAEFTNLIGSNQFWPQSRFSHLDHHLDWLHFAVKMLQTKIQKYRLFHLQCLKAWLE